MDPSPSPTQEMLAPTKETSAIPASPPNSGERLTTQSPAPNGDSDDTGLSLAPPPMPKISNALLEELYQKIVSLSHGYQYGASDYIKLLDLSMRSVETYPELKGETKKKLVLELAEKLVLDAEVSHLARDSFETAQQLAQTIQVAGPYIIELAIDASKGRVVNILKKRTKKCPCFFGAMSAPLGKIEAVQYHAP